MPPAISDYLQRPSGGNVTVLVGTWVQLTNNVSGTAYVAPAVTDANGKFTVNNVPAGTYTVATGPTNVGPFTSTGDTNYVVADFTGWLNVLDFGAKGDGATDDATAINAALTFAGNNGGGIVTLPKRATSGITVYAVGSAVIIPANVELHLGGRNAVWIQALPGITLGANNEVVRLIAGTSIGVGCRFTDGLVNANNVAGSKCWYSERINENSGVYRSAGINFMSRGLQIAQPSSGAGAQHYVIDDVEFQTSASTPAAAIALDIANTSVATPIRGIRNVSIGGTTALTTAMKVDGVSGEIANVHIENMTTGILVGSALGCFGLSIRDIDGLNNVTNLVTISNAHTQRSVILEDINPNGGTNAIVDQPNSNTPTTDEGLYVLGPNALLAVDGAFRSQLGGLTLLQQFEFHSVIATFAASYTPDATAPDAQHAQAVSMTLTGNLSVVTPAHLRSGQLFLFRWKQDGSGGHSITYDGGYHLSAAGAVTTTLNTSTIDVFFSWDGASLYLLSRFTGVT